ncbi:MAG: peptidylprolyl isomerase [Candidatus Eisenbacteria bacterium]
MRLRKLAGAARLALWIGLVSGALGCASDPPDTVLSMKGYRLNQADLKAEWERLHPGASYDTTRAAARSEFASVIADKELLLRAAREACPKPDLQRARGLRITYEKMLQRDFQQGRRQAFALSLPDMDVRLRKISRSAHVLSCGLAGKDGARLAAEALARGESFESIASKYGRPQRPGGPSGAVAEDWRAGKTPWMLLAAVMLEDLPAGTTSRPIETTQGIYLVKVLSYEPFDLTSEPGLLDRARQNLSDLAFMRTNVAYVDSLKKASGLAFHTENDSIVLSKMTAYWDSVQTAQANGKPVNFQTLRGPVWMLNKAEAAKPCFELLGKSYTVGDFIRSLDDVDLDSWPTGPPLDKTTFQLQNRVQRMMFNAEAEKRGLQHRPIFVERMKRVEESGLLDQYRETAVLPKVQPTEQELRATFEKDASQFVTPDMGSFGVIIFPADKVARAKEVRAKLDAGDPLLWYEIGLAEQKLDPRVQLYADTKDIDLNGAPPIDASWAPFMDLARTLETGQIGGPLRTQHGVSLMRMAKREHSRPMSFDEAKPRVTSFVVERKADQMIEETLTAGRKRYGLKLYKERLGGA